MKTIVSLTLALLLICPAIFAQEKEEKTQNPGEKITVNKEYDDQGNLIRFDSTYVFEWHGDTMMAFPNGGNFTFTPNGFPDMDNFMNHFFGDSVFNSPFGGNWNQEFMRRHEEMMKNFGFPFDENGFMDSFSFGSDSLNFFFQNDSTGNFTPFFNGFDNFPDFSQFFKGFEGFEDERQPAFDNQEQEKEWKDMMERQQKEQEELLKKWDSKDKRKPKVETKTHQI
jgi:hypothetical protein